VCSSDLDVMDDIDHPIAKDIVYLRRLNKVRNTYIAQFLREIEDDGRIHPMYNSHLVRTIRSSSDHPNWQNIPVRDEEAKEITRSGIFPSKGNKLLEWDYKAIEVRIAAVYTKDPVLIDYIHDPNSDMHTDQASRLFCVHKDDVSKDMRFYTKNGFVFPSFYGSYWKNTGKSLWDNVVTCLKTKSGVPVMDNLRLKGKLYTSEEFPTQFDAFLEHVRKEEEIFWKKFKVFKKWQDKQIENFVDKGFFRMYTGFVEEGYLTKNELINYRIQGTAFHCLLWSIIQLNKYFTENGFRTKIVGQIHDSCIYDLYPPEEKEVIDITEYYATKAIREEFKFINVPLAIEWDSTEVDCSWYTKKGM
jgi:DNA polymerase I